MKELSPIEILDKMLEWFALDMEDFLKTPSQHVNNNISKPEAITEIGRCFKELNTMMFLMYADLAFDKLFRDGYLTSNDVGYSGRERLYSISFEGKLFSKLGGYKKSLNDARNENQIKVMKDWLLIFGTFLAGIGALALVLWEIYKHYFLHID